MTTCGGGVHPQDEVLLTDQTADSIPLCARIVSSNGQVLLWVEGYGTRGSAPGHGALAVLEQNNGRLRLNVWDSIDMEEPVVIDLEGAKQR